MRDRSYHSRCFSTKCWIFLLEMSSESKRRCRSNTVSEPHDVTSGTSCSTSDTCTSAVILYLLELKYKCTSTSEKYECTQVNLYFIQVQSNILWVPVNLLVLAVLLLVLSLVLTDINQYQNRFCQKISMKHTDAWIKSSTMTNMNQYLSIPILVKISTGLY